MNRKASALFSLGASVALIAAVIWVLNCLLATPWGRHGYGNGAWHHWMMGGAGATMVIFWVMVVAAVVLLVGGAIIRGSHSEDVHHIEDAREILDQRFARGEIDDGQYEEMKRDLRRQ